MLPILIRLNKEALLHPSMHVCIFHSSEEASAVGFLWRPELMRSWRKTGFLGLTKALLHSSNWSSTCFW